MTRAESAQARVVYLQPGDVLGAYRVLSLHTPAATSRDRLYHVEATCCDVEMVRSHKSLVECRRVGRMQCLRCACAQPSGAHLDNSLLAVGEVVGPVTIIALDIPLWRRVRWACCGKEEALSVQRLYTFKHRAKSGQTPVCRACTDAAKRATKGQRQRHWLPATAILPPGIIPAALAWPRPGVRA